MSVSHEGEEETITRSGPRRRRDQKGARNEAIDDATRAQRARARGATFAQSQRERRVLCVEERSEAACGERGVQPQAGGEAVAEPSET